MRPRTSNFRHTRRSRQFYVDGLNEPGLVRRVRAGYRGEGYYTYMFSEDVQYLLPFGNGREDDFRVTVSGENAENATRLLTEALPSEFERRTIEEALRDFVNRTGQLMMGSGFVPYEVDYLSSSAPSDDDQPVGFRVALIHPGSLGRRAGRPIQYVPDNLAEHHDRRGSGYVELEPDNVIIFRLTGRLDRDVQRAVRFLSIADGLQAAEYALLEASMRQPTAYDPTAAHRMLGDLIAEGTVPLGWNVRGLYREGRLDPYIVWRALEFARLKIRIRDGILSQLNEALVRIGRRLRFNISLQCTGVPTLTDVDKAEHDLHQGARPISQLMRIDA